MALHRIEHRQVVPVDLDTAWRFFSDPRNLARMTPPEMALIPTGPVPDHMHAGMIIPYRIRPFPRLSFEWVTEITHVVERQFFVDEQRSGPYAFWHHQHHFREATGGTEVRDVIHYRLPFAPLSDVLLGHLVRRRVNAIFAFRRRALEQADLLRSS